MELRHRLATAEPGQCRVATRLRHKLRSVSAILRPRPATLLVVRNAYERALELRHRLASAEPVSAERQRDLANSLDRIGNTVTATGDLAAARRAYEQALELRHRLRSAEPANAQWQRSVIGLGRMAMLPMRLVILARSPPTGRMRRTLDFGRALIAADPGNALWQRDVSVSLNNIGDVLVAQCHLEALKAFRDGLAIANGLARAYPGTRAGSATYRKRPTTVWVMFWSRRGISEALKTFREGSVIRERLAAADPDVALAARPIGVEQQGG